MKRSVFAAAVAAFTAVALTACSTGKSLEGGEQAKESAASSKIVVGSQDYYSNEILAEVYAQALEGSGFTVERQLRIGQREVYMPELESGSIDVFPEYTGNLLQYFDKDASARADAEVYQALGGALPKGLRVLDEAPATDQDSYVVTTAFASEHSLSSIGDLANAGQITLGGNSGLAARP